MVGPRGFTMLSCALDLREGGAWRMRISSDETVAIQTEVGVYREIREPERLSFTHASVRANGTLTPTTLVTVRFTERQAAPRSFRQKLRDRLACLSHVEPVTRRAILARLALGESAVGELAQPFAMTLPAISKHLKVLERAGLIARGREAQRQTLPARGRAVARGAGMGVRLPPLLGSAA